MAKRKKVTVTLKNGKISSFEGNYQTDKDYELLQINSHTVSKLVDTMVEVMDRMNDSIWDRMSQDEKINSIFESDLNSFDSKADLHETIQSVTIS